MPAGTAESPYFTKRSALRGRPCQTGSVRVAIFSTTGFDAAAIIPDSLRLTDALPARGDHGEISDINGDGRNDMLVSFMKGTKPFSIASV